MVFIKILEMNFDEIKLEAFEEAAVIEEKEHVETVYCSDLFEEVKQEGKVEFEKFYQI